MSQGMGNSSKPAKSRDLRQRMPWETLPIVTSDSTTSAVAGRNSTLLAAGLCLAECGGTNLARK
jgi:hypothetical protein